MYLHALGHFHPPNLLTNAFFEELGLETSDAWIMERVGIRARHTVLPLDYLRETRNRDVRAAQEAALFSNAETGRRAAVMALERAGLKPSDIGLVVAGGCSPDECIPAESNRVAQLLGINAPAVDLQSACSSFCMQLHFLTGMRPERLPDYVLVVNMDNSTRVVDYTDRSSAVLWGDGASAAILSPRVPGRWHITETLLAGDPSGADKVRVPRVGHFTQQGGEVQKFAIRRAGETFQALRARFMERHPEKGAGAVALIGHQANLRMLESVQRRCEVPEARHFFNVNRRGNTGAAGAPSVLSEHWDDPTVGDAVVLSVVGSGLTWAGALLERTAAK
ncbi:3-oxoacyl-ACP synthase III family protein [Corallococcus macrosporus]|uniref:3-oxoacyl-[acyl-carrier-protein] synthase III n=1 Tax=Myxococcus fulvus (strain ATCC BAA-855 / HW-1) TaxID=483219 RepID=F8CM55_MYXFH|nr:ketoacyl-ACP synthase III [Corallococcus macrosporus]AEI62823.1 3-oxoacyl-[acyl-carrier-protein] synthase III [Corallococcus macrosporus]